MSENSEGSNPNNQKKPETPAISLDDLPTISSVTARWPLGEKKEQKVDRSILTDTEGRKFRLVPQFDDQGKPVLDEEGTEVLKKEYIK